MAWWQSIVAWWQSIPYLYQAILSILGGIVGALLVSLPLGYVILRIISPPWKHYLSKGEPATAAKEQVTSVAQPHDSLTELVKKHEELVKTHQELVKNHQETTLTGKNVKSTAQEYDAFSESIKKYQETAVFEEQIESRAPNLFLEVKNNLALAAKPFTNMLFPFETNVWDTNPGEVDSLPADVQEELRQAYVDMRLANDIVWLATEIGRRSRNLDEGYIRLCSQITLRLDKVTPTLKATR